MLAHVLDNKMGTFSFPSTTSLKLVSTIRFIFHYVFNDAVNCWDYMASVKMNEWVWSIFGMIMIGEDRNTRSKTCPNLLCPPQIPRGLAWNRTRASAVRGRWPTAWAMARPILYHHSQFLKHNLWYYPSTFCRSLKWSRFEMFPLKNKFPVVLHLTFYIYLNVHDWTIRTISSEVTKEFRICHEAYFTRNYWNFTNILLLISYFGNVNLYWNSDTWYSLGLACWVSVLMVIRSNPSWVTGELTAPIDLSRSVYGHLKWQGWALLRTC